MAKQNNKTNPFVQFIEFCGTHPFATGIFALVSITSFVFAIYSNTQTSQENKRIEQSLDSVRTIIDAKCSSPPCWTAEEAISGILDRTKDYVDGKIGSAIHKDVYGWHYTVDDCSIKIYYHDETAIYLSHPLNEACPFSWASKFGINQPMPEIDSVSVNDILNALSKERGYPRLNIATGCLSCGNYHEAYIEFVVPGPHVANFYDRYFTIGFLPRDRNDDFYYNGAFAKSLEASTGKDTSGALKNYCGVNVLSSVSDTIRNLPVSSIGYGRAGRKEYPVDICNDGYAAQ